MYQIKLLLDFHITIRLKMHAGAYLLLHPKCHYQITFAKDSIKFIKHLFVSDWQGTMRTEALTPSNELGRSGMYV